MQPNTKMLLVSLGIFFLMFFLNYIANLYTDDVFQYDLDIAKKKGQNRLKKLLFILKNNHSLSIAISFAQTILNVMFSETLPRFFWGNTQPSIWIILLFTIITMIIIEFVPRYIANKTKKILYNVVLVNLTYFITQLSAFIFRLEPKKKITSYSEKDVIRYVKNLSVDNIIEIKEAQLVQAAFNFDELTIENAMTPYKKIVFLDEESANSEMKKNCSNYTFSIFPVQNKNGEIIGTFDFQKWSKKEKETQEQEIKWQAEIKKNFLQINKNETLDKILDLVKKEQLELAIVYDIKTKKNIGLITKKDVFDALIGKIKRQINPKIKKKRMNKKLQKT